jgi:RNA polymerase sigma-70 factor (ECF subfamily)
LGETVDEVSPERVLIDRQTLGCVCAALDQLPEKTRRIFLMNRIGQIPHRRIAEMLGISDEAVYYHIRRALERLAVLRDELSD